MSLVLLLGGGGISRATAAAPQTASGVRAGVGVVDATWHVGASAGQYATPYAGLDVPPELDTHALLTAPTDPNLHQVKKNPSYGVQSRLSVRAIVVEGNDHRRIALLKSDNYLAQDLLIRRVGQLLATGTSGVDYAHILYNVSHDHSSPYYTTPATGVWLFQDSFDLRMFEYQARAMATAIEQASSHLVPVRMGASVEHLDSVFRNAPGGSLADDGSPTGYPHHENDTQLVVLRFDDISKPSAPRPLATWMNFGVHPEDLDGYNLISGDYIAPLQRMVGRATGAPLIFSQGDVGSSEPIDDKNVVLPNGVVQAFSHEGYAQSEREARIIADKVMAGWQEIGAGRGTVPYSTSFPVAIVTNWVPGPVSHPYPSVSNCRTETTLRGAVGIPLVGLPDCDRGRLPALPPGVGALYDALKAAGVPVPENYDVPSFAALEENARLKLQVARLGDVVLASCACEPQVDLVKNFKSRADAIPNNIYDGFAWEALCHALPGGTWRCPDPGDGTGKRTVTVTDAAYKRMVAEVHNDARGWDAPSNAPYADAEPLDPSQIRGNFTKEELPPRLGFKLPVLVGHAGDYNGYTVSYRMYMSYDHYRKALTSYGPHTADYMVTRLVRMVASLRTGAPLAKEPLDAAARADEARQQAESLALGKLSSAAFDTYAKTMPDDGAAAGAVTQPKDITRFDGATFSWRGGDNYIDNPVVRIERNTSHGWTTFADQSGEVQTMVKLPTGPASVATRLVSPADWVWTANFEAADFFPRDIDGRGPNVPDGQYRYVVDGNQWRGGKQATYHLVSRVFTVAPWRGVRVRGIRVERNGAIDVDVAAIAYPRTYASPFPFVHDDKGAPICKTCSFRPWATTGDVRTIFVRITKANGTSSLVAATRGADGIWRTKAKLKKGERALVAAGGVTDSYGEHNGVPSATVTR